MKERVAILFGCAVLGACMIEATITPLPDAGSDTQPPIDCGVVDAPPLDTWTPVTPLPTARYAHASVAHNGRLYVLGGDQGGNVQRNDVLVAPILPNGALGSWSSTTPFPIPRAGHAGVVANGYVYVLGGGNAASQQIADVSYAPIGANGTVGPWATTTPLPSPRQSFSVVARGGKLYAIAGNYGAGGVNWQDVQMATLNADGSLGAWTALTPLPAPRSVHAAVAEGGHLYVLGGGVSGAPGPNDDVLVAPFNADGTIGAWSLSTPFPMPRAWHASVGVGGALFVIGGADNSGEFDDVRSAPFLPSGGAGAWAAKPPLPGARAGLGSAVSSGRVYVTGGVRTGSTILGDAYVFTPSGP